MPNEICCPPPGPGLHPRLGVSTGGSCTPGTTLSPAYFRVPGVQALVAGFVKVVTSADCTYVTTHVDGTGVDLGGLFPTVDVAPVALAAGLLPVNTLATPSLARQLAAGAASANTALTATCRRISIHATGSDIRYVIGAGAQTATAASHFIAEGERLDLAVPAGAQIAVLRAGGVDGVLELSELV